MISSYRKGRRIELDLVRKLKKDKRFHVVVRSAGSRTPFDTVAVSRTRILLIQVKSGKGRFRKQIRKLGRIRVPDCARKQLWVYDKGWKLLYSS